MSEREEHVMTKTTLTCWIHNVADMTPAQIEGRIGILTAWPENLLSAIGDPRCGCGAPDGVCQYDAIEYLEGLL